MRRQYLIDRKFQLTWALRIFAIMFVVSLAVGWTIYYVVWDATTNQLKALVAQGVLSQAQLLPISSTIKASIGFALIFRSAVILFALAVLTVFLTHRIAGPIFKIRKTLRLIGEGETSERIHLRKRDEYKDLADEMNSLIDQLQGTSRRQT
jgi:signal transduction histidine kinase